MMKRFVVLFFAALLVAFASLSASGFVNEKQQSYGFSHKADYVPGEVIVKFKSRVSSASADAFHKQIGARKLERLQSIGAEVLSVSERFSVEEAVRLYLSNPDVEYAEPNYIYTASKYPDDPDFTSLWGLHNTGQTGGTEDADIDGLEAWDITTGSDSVVIAVIDTGVDYTHPDLAANIWTNTGEIPGNGMDDEGNGFIDDVHGYDFVNNDGDPMDDHFHGTHVAGTIGAAGNDGKGVVGVNWKVKIMPIKFLSASGSGSLSGAVKAIGYATKMGAMITNNSWGGGPYAQSLKDAIVSASKQNSLFVAAAGNSGTDNDISPIYPSSYEVANVIAVAATDHNDSLASFSCYGAESVDLAAPGVKIKSTYPDSKYGTISGTSMATPHVSGVAGLLLANDPGATVQELKSKLFGSVDPIPEL
ncbi:MAG: S8 family peptidase, partial [Bacillota bacterium]|nr:S8 family peptidase [Bacillota bacterium]